MASFLPYRLIYYHHTNHMMGFELTCSIIWFCDRLKSKMDRAYDLIQNLPPKAILTSSMRQDARARSTSSIESLPNELKLAIFKNIPDVSSLHAAALTSKGNYHLYDTYETTILPEVFALDTGTYLFEEAYWVLKASRLNITQANQDVVVNTFLGEWMGNEAVSMDAADIPLEDIYDMVKLHKIVERLVEDFCRYAAEKNDSLKDPKGSAVIPSASEFKRIARAFYRFEFFGHLFRHPQVHGEDYDDRKHGSISMNVQQQAGNMFTNLHPWQVEEVACIRDYSFDRLEAVFDALEKEKVLDPIHWIEVSPFRPEPPNLPPGFRTICDDIIPEWFDSDSDYSVNLTRKDFTYDDLREAHLAFGLTHLCNLFTAKTHEDRYRVFQKRFDPTQISLNTHFFLTHALKAGFDASSEELEDLEAFYHGDRQEFEDEESGPNAAWVWANDSKMELRYNQSWFEGLRPWGYVMWDKVRLADILSKDINEVVPYLFHKDDHRLPENHEEVCLRGLTSDSLHHDSHLESTSEAIRNAANEEPEHNSASEDGVALTTEEDNMKTQHESTSNSVEESTVDPELYDIEEESESSEVSDDESIRFITSPPPESEGFADESIEPTDKPQNFDQQTNAHEDCPSFELGDCRTFMPVNRETKSPVSSTDLQRLLNEIALGASHHGCSPQEEATQAAEDKTSVCSENLRIAYNPSAGADDSQSISQVDSDFYLEEALQTVEDEASKAPEDSCATYDPFDDDEESQSPSQSEVESTSEEATNTAEDEASTAPNASCAVYDTYNDEDESQSPTQTEDDSSLEEARQATENETLKNSEDYRDVFDPSDDDDGESQSPSCTDAVSPSEQLVQAADDATLLPPENSCIVYDPFDEDEDYDDSDLIQAIESALSSPSPQPRKIARPISRRKILQATDSTSQESIPRDIAVQPAKSTRPPGRKFAKPISRALKLGQLLPNASASDRSTPPSSIESTTTPTSSDEERSPEASGPAEIPIDKPSAVTPIPSPSDSEKSLEASIFGNVSTRLSFATPVVSQLTARTPSPEDLTFTNTSFKALKDFKSGARPATPLKPPVEVRSYKPQFEVSEIADSVAAIEAPPTKEFAAKTKADIEAERAEAKKNKAIRAKVRKEANRAARRAAAAEEDATHHSDNAGTKITDADVVEVQTTNDDVALSTPQPSSTTTNTATESRKLETEGPSTNNNAAPPPQHSSSTINPATELRKLDTAGPSPNDDNTNKTTTPAGDILSEKLDEASSVVPVASRTTSSDVSRFPPDEGRKRSLDDSTISVELGAARLLDEAEKVLMVQSKSSRRRQRKKEDRKKAVE